MWVKQVVLWLLSKHETHAFKARADMALLLEFRPPNSQITQACHALREHGWAVSRDEWIGKNKSKKRVIYSITPAGTAELQRWIGAPIDLTRDDSSSVLRALILLSDKATRLRPALLDAKQKLWTQLQDLHDRFCDMHEVSRAWLSLENHRLAAKLRWIDDVLALLPDEPPAATETRSAGSASVFDRGKRRPF
jgi:DNA-binding PadR family transcriptional regulator